MDTNTIVMAIVLVVYNLATIKLLSVALKTIDLKEAVREKAIPAGAAAPNQVNPASAAAPNVAAGDVQTPGDTSYGRVAGLIGATVMATFFWSVGNVIVYKAFFSPAAEIKDFVSGLASYFLGGSSLFLP